MKAYVTPATLPLRLALLLAVCAAPASAQDARDVLTADFAHVHERVLDNGLTVVVIEDHALPIVTVEVAVHGGAFIETPEYSGLSHLYEHMFFKGNQAIPNQEAYLARQRELGMSWNGTTSEERVNYFFTMGSQQLCDGLIFMSNAIRTPLFDQAELERERQVVLGEVDRNESNPYYHLREAVEDLLWYEFPNRKDALGSRETIASATRDQMMWLQNVYYVPNNAALFIAGDVTPEAGFELAEAAFGQWQPGPDPFELYPPVVHPPLERSQGVIVEQDVQNVTVMLALHGPSVGQDTESTFAADVFSFIVAQQAHRFQQNLVDTGLVLGVELSYYTQAHTGPIYLFAQMQPERVVEALQAIHEEIVHFTDPDYYTDEQIETAKTLLAVSELYSRQQTTSWVHTVSFWWAVAGLDYYRDYVENLVAVDRDDIDRYIRTYIQDQPFVLGALMSPSTRASLGLTEDDFVRAFQGQPATPAAPATE